MSSSNDLTKAIIRVLQYNGHHAERVNNIARQINGHFVKSGNTKGTADIHACIYGYFVAIEVKIGKDRQSLWQKEYQKSVQKARGYYWIVNCFDDFENNFNDFVKDII